jgi:hypothetical protein
LCAAKYIGTQVYYSLWHFADQFNRLVFFPLLDVLSFPDLALDWFTSTTPEERMAIAVSTPFPIDDVVIGGIAALGKLPKTARMLAKYYNAIEYVPSKYRAIVSSAFEGEIKAITLKDDLIVYRYWGGKSTETGSAWFSTKQYVTPGNARRYLALPEGNTAENVTAFRIPSGTTILEGKVSSKTGEVGFGSYATGKGTQIYLPNPTLATPIR